MATFDGLMANLVLEGFFSFAFAFSVYIMIIFFKVMIQRDLMLFFTNLITIGYLGWRNFVFLQSILEDRINLFPDKWSLWMVNYIAYMFLSAALTLSLIEWTKIRLATQSLVLKSLTYYTNKKSFLIKASLIILPIKFGLGFITSISYWVNGLALKFYWFFDGIFLVEMGILFIINAKTFVTNIRTYYYEYFKEEMIIMQLTLILSSLSYLFRSAYLLVGFVFFENGIKEAEERIFMIKNKSVMLLWILVIVFLTEMLPIASLILTNAFIVQQKSIKMKTIGQQSNNLLEEQGIDSDVEDSRTYSVAERIRSIRSVIIDEFIDKEDQNSKYHYQMKDKNAGREIFWTYHFFEYIDDYIESNSQVNLINDEPEIDDSNAFSPVGSESPARHKHRVSSRKEKLKLLDRDAEVKCRDFYTSLSSRVDE